MNAAWMIAGVVWAAIAVLSWYFPRRPWQVGTLALAVAALSLISVYHVSHDSAIRDEFAKIGRGDVRLGGFVEFARHCIYFVICVHVVASVFKPEGTILLSAHSGGRAVWLARAAYVFISLWILCEVTRYHVAAPRGVYIHVHVKDGVPEKEAEDRYEAEKSTNAFRRKYVEPYLSLLPQSLVHYLFWATPMLVIPWYASWGDWHSGESAVLSMKKREFQKPLLLQDERDIKDGFETFSRRTLDLIKRYSALPCWMFVALAYDVWLGRPTLSDRAYTYRVFEIALIASSGVMCVFVAIQHQQYQAATMRHFPLRESDWAEHFSTINVLRRAGRESVVLIFMGFVGGIGAVVSLLPSANAK